MFRSMDTLKAKHPNYTLVKTLWEVLEALSPDGSFTILMIPMSVVDKSVRQDRMK